MIQVASNLRHDSMNSYIKRPMEANQSFDLKPSNVSILAPKVFQDM